VKLPFRKQQPPQPVTTGFTAKARLRNIGDGTIELVDNTVKFYLEKGRFRRLKQVAKEIPFADIETVERVENELNVTWKGATDRFVIGQAELAEAMRTKISEALDAQKRTLEAKDAPKQKRSELAQALSSALKITDSLFDILRSLNGRVDWNRVENTFECSKEYFRRFSDQKGAVNLDYAKLSSAITEHLPEDISKEAHGILKVLFDFFNGLPPQGEFPAQSHPNPEDAKKVILAYYTLNDMILGLVVGDGEVGKESNELVAVLDDLAKDTGLTIDVAAVKDAVNKSGVDQEEESIIEESRAVLLQQLNALVIA
jgi:hypothetical protein